MVVGGKGRRLFISIRFWVLLGIFLVSALFPFYWMVLTSLKTTAEIYSSAPGQEAPGLPDKTRQLPEMDRRLRRILCPCVLGHDETALLAGTGS